MVFLAIRSISGGMLIFLQHVVVMPNFHGSTSFGQDFAISIHGAHGEKPLVDVMNAADYMIEKGFIDENRIAATGSLRREEAMADTW